MLCSTNLFGQEKRQIVAYKFQDGIDLIIQMSLGFGFLHTTTEITHSILVQILKVFRSIGLFHRGFQTDLGMQHGELKQTLTKAVGLLNFKFL